MPQSKVEYTCWFGTLGPVRADKALVVAPYGRQPGRGQRIVERPPRPFSPGGHGSGRVGSVAQGRTEAGRQARPGSRAWSAAPRWPRGITERSANRFRSANNLSIWTGFAEFRARDPRGRVGSSSGSPAPETSVRAGLDRSGRFPASGPSLQFAHSGRQVVRQHQVDGYAAPTRTPPDAAVPEESACLRTSQWSVRERTAAV